MAMLNNQRVPFLEWAEIINFQLQRSRLHQGEAEGRSGWQVSFEEGKLGTTP